MKLMCKTEVYNRLSVQLQNARKKKSQNTVLAVGYPCKGANYVNLLLKSSTDKNGSKYKMVKDNVQIFASRVHEGKSTIRFITPAHDIIIQAEPIQLKSFLHVIKLALENKFNAFNATVLSLSDLEFKGTNEALKTKIVIKQASKYPTFEGFSRITEELHIAGLQRKSFDRQILRLHSLRILNLSDNLLTSLPQELGMLPNLQEIDLSGNKLGRCLPSRWSWLNGSKIRNSLLLLNLSNNELEAIPIQMTKLAGLITLNLSSNQIKELPQGIGNMKKLKFLVLSQNRLNKLPGSIVNLFLSTLDLSDNPLMGCQNDLQCLEYAPNLSLVDISAQKVIKHRIYYDRSIIPYTLVDYLDQANFCVCGTACFNSSLRRLVPMSLSRFARSYTFPDIGGNNILFDCYFCSTRCVRRYARV